MQYTTNLIIFVGRSLELMSDKIDKTVKQIFREMVENFKKINWLYDFPKILQTGAEYKRSLWRWLIIKTNCYCLQYLPPYCLKYFTLSIPFSATKELRLLSRLLVIINRSQSWFTIRRTFACLSYFQYT